MIADLKPSTPQNRHQFSVKNKPPAQSALQHNAAGAGNPEEDDIRSTSWFNDSSHFRARRVSLVRPTVLMISSPTSIEEPNLQLETFGDPKIVLLSQLTLNDVQPFLNRDCVIYAAHPGPSFKVMHDLWKFMWRIWYPHRPVDAEPRKDGGVGQGD